ncbi:MAG: cyclomaltodextrinase C-terminal domain-containing protein [Saprospiraceae bacterium]|nr:cyclomaltodextrinase C-terminal domain-containing protein [Saprospiraceae bacterium]
MPSRTVSAIREDILVEPPNWWTHMQHREVELLVRRANVARCAVHLGKTEGVTLRKVRPGDSPNYLFITLALAPEATPQRVPIYFTPPDGQAVFIHEFPVLPRSKGPKAQGLDSRDVLYMIFPDRFANGDPANDSVPGLYEGTHRQLHDGRHGGDLKGISDHLDYLQDLGVTALWLNPELENNQRRTSYHGYAITDLYRIDRRMGTNELYRELVNQCHLRGIKVVRDVVPNHIGDGHPWAMDPPTKDWIHTWPEMTYTNSRAPSVLDPYASDWDKKRFNEGWFASAMPDLNQQQPQLANYLVQQAIWWVEFSGLDAYRIDTYSFCDQAFMSRWCSALRAEYPSIHLFGEIWEHSVLIQGFFADGQPMARAGFNSHLPGVVDFQLCFAIQEALTREQGWTEGAARIYYTLAQDYFYKDPFKNVVMLDNHDMTRFFSVVGEDLNKFKSGLVFLLSTRGIPQLYYGTEILSTGKKEAGDDALRREFPGGWPGDPANKFTAAGRTARENEAFEFTRSLIRYRNATPALQTGKLMQFAPENGVYCYFRYDADKTVMVLLNTAGQEKTIGLDRFAERLQGFTRAKEVLSGKIWERAAPWTLPANTALLLEWMP